MVEDKGKKPKVSEKGEDDNSDNIDEKLVLSIEKLQEIQDELEKVIPSNPFMLMAFFEAFFFWLIISGSICSPKIRQKIIVIIIMIIINN